MTHERIENALSSEIPADERRYVPRPIPATIEAARVQLAAAPQASHALALIAAAAALAIVAVVGWTAWRSVGTPDDGLGDGTASVAPSPSAMEAGPVACAAADFVISSDPWDGAAGSRGTIITFRAVDSVTGCTLAGRMTVSVVEPDGTVLVAGGSDGGPAVAVIAGTQLEVGVAWSNWCGDPPTARIQLVATLPGDSTKIEIAPPSGTGILVPPCMGEAQPSALSVTSFQPSERPPIDQ